MISMSFRTGTGFMKCMPITWWALEGITPPIFVKLIEEVLLARIACLGVTAAKSSKILAFKLKSSLTASIAKSTSFKPCYTLS